MMNTDGNRERRDSELNVRIIQSILRRDEKGTENRKLGASTKLHFRVINISTYSLLTATQVYIVTMKHETRGQ